VSVNLSAWQLRRQALMDVVEAALSLHDLPASLLEFEITEDAAMKNPGFTASVLADLTGMGVAVALDDFGTGRSSLEHLRRFPLTSLKIDQAFIKDCHLHSKDGAIVAAVIALAHSLDLQVLAEGVEKPEQAEFLRNAGCDMAQGYYFSHPLPPEDLPAFIAARAAGR
jgi:EAL domain-containing protein (putative c-di-GMP-specific phosphodiesterase class I)